MEACWRLLRRSSWLWLRRLTGNKSSIGCPGGGRSFSSLRESGRLERSGKEYVLKSQGAKVPPPYGVGTLAPEPNEALTLAAICELNGRTAQSTSSIGTVRCWRGSVPPMGREEDYTIEPGADLAGADLTKANLIGADLIALDSPAAGA